mmetsp:Transcript_24744/g.28503  ORF Transcript_24744/g.28503 Transcript_24744/m.28503 type:complete len:88 (+) Transcript_24744:949-1212(+)
MSMPDIREIPMLSRVMFDPVVNAKVAIHKLERLYLIADSFPSAKLITPEILAENKGIKHIICKKTLIITVNTMSMMLTWEPNVLSCP